ncbi:hypothetical protein [Deinococcus sp. PEB2-63]
MPWTLEIWNPTRTQRLKTLSSDTATELDGGFRWQLDQYGDCRQWEATGRNDRLGIPPRAVIRFVVDGTPWFHGVIVDPPSVTSPDAEALTALGGREILAAALMDGTAYRNRGVYQIARDILSRLCPPALTYDATQIGDGSGTDAGPGLNTFYSPTATLADVMDALAKSAGVPWGVDTLGRPFLGRPASPALAVPYAGQPWRRLTVQGREACTQAVLRVVSAPSLPDSGTATYTYGLPATVTTTATHAQHPTYRATRAVDGPDGVGLVRPAVPASTARSSSYDAAPVLDDNAGTYVTVDLTNVQRILGVRSAAARVVGVEFDYALPGTQDSPTDPFGWTLAYFPADGIASGILPVSNGIRTVRVILPPGINPPANWTADFTIGAMLAVSPTPSTRLFVYRVRFLTVDEDAALRAATSALQVPYGSPAEIALDRLVPPTPTVTVTGSPDGDATGPAAQFEYTHLPLQPRRTVVKLGATGQSAAARELRFGGAR